MTQWIATRYNAQVAVIVRHPCGFASSLESLGWPLSTYALLRQDELMQQHLSRFESLLRRVQHDKWMTRSAIWGCINHVLLRQAANSPDWFILKYEDLCKDPEGRLKELARHLDMELHVEAMESAIANSQIASTDPGSTQRISSNMPHIWKTRMSPAQIDSVLGVAREFGLGLYPGT
jgi:hypothetical protein